MLKLLATVLAIGALISTALPARADDPISGTVLDVDDRAFPEVTAILTIVDAGGRPITGLSPTAFTAQETGASASVTRVETVLNEQVGVGVILTLDTSGSMFGSAMTQAKAAASAFVKGLQSTDQTAVVSFSSQVTVQDSLTPNRDSALAALDRLAARGDTALYGAVVESINIARGAPLPRKAIILLSDGVDFGGVSTATRDQTLALASEARVPIFAIGLGTGIDRTYLQELARLTGGAFFETPSPGGVAALYDQLSHLLRSQYVVTLRSNARPDVTDRSLNLAVNTSAGSTRLRVDYKTRRTIVEAPVAPDIPPPIVPPPAEPSGGSQLPVLLALVLLLIVVTAGSGSYVYRWRRNRRLAAELAALSQRAAGFSAAPVAVTEMAKPEISILVDGPRGTMSFPVGDEPMTIGSGSSCQVRLEANSPDVSGEHARVWSSGGKLMFHQLAAGQPSLIRGAPVTWVALGAGDEVQIGPFSLRVEIKPASG